MRRYETTFILTPDLEEADLEKNITRYTGIITGQGGTIEKEDRWGIRRMAYQINKKTQGYYVHLVHESGIEIPRELERQFLLNESCMRYLTVRAEKPVPPPEPKTPVAKEPTSVATDSTTEPAAETPATTETKNTVEAETTPTAAKPETPVAGEEKSDPPSAPPPTPNPNPSTD